MINGFCIFL